MKALLMAFGLIFLSACNLFSDKSPLKFEEKTKTENLVNLNENQQDFIEQLQYRNRLLLEKDADWAKIVQEANEDFKELRPLVKKNCFGCHNSNKELAWFKKPIPSLRKHYKEGVEALDFTNNFPLKAKGNPPQLSLLKAMRNEVVDRTMPLKVYTLVYPFRKITNKDEKRFLNWLDPLIEKIENFEEKYTLVLDDGTLKSKVAKVFSFKCLRCHGNGNDEGKFGNIEKMNELLKSKFVDAENPEMSLVYTQALDGEMPPRGKDQLTPQELEYVLTWIQESTK